MGKITHCPEEGELKFDDDFDDDAARTTGHAPGFPPAYMMGRAILVISGGYLSDVRGALAKAGVKCHAIV